MSNSPKITEPPTEPPKVEEKPVTEPPKTVTEPPTEPPKVVEKPVTEPPKVEEKSPTEPPKPVEKLVTEPPKAVEKSPTEPPKPVEKPVTEPPKVVEKSPTEPPKKELVLKPKRKQSPKQLANLSKGRGKPKVGASDSKSTESPIEKVGEVKPNKTFFYAGIAIGVLAGSFGILKLYQMWKNKQNPELAQPNVEQSPQLAEPKLTPKELERLQKIQIAKRNFPE